MTWLMCNTTDYNFLQRIENALYKKRGEIIFQ